MESEFCRCWDNGVAARNHGWSLEPSTGYWVCGNCRKPSKYSQARECEWCEKKFLPKVYVEPEYEVVCDECS